MLPVGAIVLAAGEGRRVGLGPKALLVRDGHPFLETCVGACREGGCDPIWVVVRNIPELARLAGALGARVVVNEDPERGMFSSVRCGLRGIEFDAVRGIIVYPVDHPRVKASTMQAIVAELKDEDTWVVPVHGGRPGHPIGIGVRVARRISRLPDSFTLRAALEHVGAERVDVAVDDAGILENVNTPEDL
jgi:molybdenum cofactor cytidylyltransferase